MAMSALVGGAVLAGRGAGPMREAGIDFGTEAVRELVFGQLPGRDDRAPNPLSQETDYEGRRISGRQRSKYSLRGSHGSDERGTHREGADIFYDYQGNGPLLLLISGGGGEAARYRRGARHIRRQGSRGGAGAVQHLPGRHPRPGRRPGPGDAMANGEFFMAHEYLPLGRYSPDFEEAELLGCRYTEFPGHHLSFILEPVDFAEALRAVLRSFKMQKQ
jgi:hypothetical protein